MRPIIRNLLIAAIAVLLLAWILYPKFKPAVTAPSGTAAGPARPVTVQTYIVRVEPLENKVQTTGSLLANEEVNLTSEASGKVVGLFFTEGGRVRKGQLLAQLNDQDLNALLQKAESNRELAKAQEYRQKILLEKQAVSQQEYDITVAQLRNTQAEIDLLKAQLLKTQIRAPFDGVIGLRRVSDGSYISPGTVIATLQNLDVLKIEFSIPEKYAGSVQAGARIHFKVRSSERTFQATIYAIEPRIDPTTRNLTLRAQTSNPGILLPGAFADVELVLSREERALMIPNEALVPDPNALRVFLKKNGKAELRDLTTGIRTKDKIQVLKGIALGDTVITTGLLQLKNGSAIQAAATINPS